MRMPRMTTRRWLLVIAAVAIALLPANGLANRRANFLARAAEYRRIAIEIRLRNLDAFGFDRVASAYERAARSPWSADPYRHVCGKMFRSLLRR
jgi:hypothetical protein